MSGRTEGGAVPSALQPTRPPPAPPLTWLPPSSPRERGEGAVTNAGDNLRHPPSPLAGEGAPKGRMRGSGRNERFQDLIGPASSSTPHPTSLRSSTFSHRGRREARGLHRIAKPQRQLPSPRLRGEDAGRQMRGSADVCNEMRRSRQPISPLEGEMSGRTEGGAVPPTFQQTVRRPRRPSPGCRHPLPVNGARAL